MVPLILDSAERLLAHQDALSVSIRDIAEEAGIPHSAIYRYFESKEDVLRQVLMRGRDRQRESDAARRASGRPLEGATEWIMTENRCYVMALARAAMQGQIGSLLGLAASESAAMQSVGALKGGTLRFERRTHDLRLVVAATMALSLGWAVAEDWIVDATGLGDRDRHAVRSDIDEILGSLVALAEDPGESQSQA